MCRARKHPVKKTLYVGLILLGIVGHAAAQAVPVAEDIRAVTLPKGIYGYRGMPGTIVELNDGRLLLAYTRILPEGNADGSIAGETETIRSSFAREKAMPTRPGLWLSRRRGLRT